MADDSPPRPEPSIRPAGATLRYRAGGKLDPLDLGKVVDDVHSLVCGALPGTHIKSITCDGFDLVIEVVP